MLKKNRHTIKKIAIFGAGGFGREVAFLIEDINKKKEQWEIVGFFDDNTPKEKRINGYKLLGSIEELNKTKEKLYLAIALGDPDARKKVKEKINNKIIDYPILMHPSVIISDKVEIGEGSIICAGTIITTNVKIGKHVVLNLSCTIGHDAILHDYCALMPGVNISGETEIGRCSYFGTGALTINRKKIGENTVIGAGAVIVKDISGNCTVVGNPAKPIHSKKNG